ncbi:pilus assembly protein CpaF [Parafrankia irregularis]|uniref:Pilus assembly protein CpaF n=1 Tax=Parafrankia irregularis TaxID=795642 RepID=A0A0S4QU95_9ACTN|nr:MULTISPECIES: TadA family conjugal transfer-associated ATPase [Parafrankia]CUU58412.1 pilus assembly protein CpaF [Parafrankia irregularis]
MRAGRSRASSASADAVTAAPSAAPLPGPLLSEATPPGAVPPPASFETSPFESGPSGTGPSEVGLAEAARLASNGARSTPSQGHAQRLGPLAVLLRDPEITDILVNGPDKVWIERAGRLRLTGVRFADDGAVRALAVRLAASGGRRLDTAMPFADIRLPDGIRLHAMLSPPALGGTCLSLRRPRPVPFTLDDLAAAGTLGPDTAAALRAVLAARLTALISGGTGTGKSTLLAALLDAAPATERIVLVEDTAELVLSRINVVRLEARAANVEGAGEITQRELVRQALRMRPDRLVVGEVRGAEVLDLLMAMNTGHEGGLGTVHANAAESLPARMEALGALAGLPRAALHSHLAAAVQVAIHLRRNAAGARRVAGIGVLRRGDDGLVQVVPALVGDDARELPRHVGERPARGVVQPDPEGLALLATLLRERGVRLWPAAARRTAMPRTAVPRTTAPGAGPAAPHGEPAPPQRSAPPAQPALRMRPPHPRQAGPSAPRPGAR